MSVVVDDAGMCASVTGTAGSALDGVMLKKCEIKFKTLILCTHELWLQGRFLKVTLGRRCHSFGTC